MRIFVLWLLLGTLGWAEEAWEQSLKQILAEANGRQPLPKGTTPIPVEDQVPEEEDPGAAIPS